VTDKDKQLEINYDGINYIADDDAVRLAEPSQECVDAQLRALKPIEYDVEYSAEVDLAGFNISEITLT